MTKTIRHEIYIVGGRLTHTAADSTCTFPSLALGRRTSCRPGPHPCTTRPRRLTTTDPTTTTSIKEQAGQTGEPHLPLPNNQHWSIIACRPVTP
ncbi:hypothetical protein [Micromonospora sp. NPDC023633]|uniref:hypothetical protein n=1 Tax=Micromonospora sp. NPDC023633 TaxID=3154320 RepID=UPI0033C30169